MMVKCIRCGLAYSHTRSTSALVLTYCNTLCEVADLGYSLAAFEKTPVTRLRSAAAHPIENRPQGDGLFIPLAA